MGLNPMSRIDPTGLAILILPRPIFVPRPIAVPNPGAVPLPGQPIPPIAIDPYLVHPDSRPWIESETPIGPWVRPPTAEPLELEDAADPDLVVPDNFVHDPNRKGSRRCQYLRDWYDRLQRWTDGKNPKTEFDDILSGCGDIEKACRNLRAYIELLRYYKDYQLLARDCFLKEGFPDDHVQKIEDTHNRLKRARDYWYKKCVKITKRRQLPNEV